MTKAEIMEFIERTKEQTANINTLDNFSTATDVIKALREAEYRGYMKAVAERPQGEWLLSDLQSLADNDNGNYAYVCTNCNHTDIHAKTQEVPYCWWCGAKMKG